MTDAAAVCAVAGVTVDNGWGYRQSRRCARLPSAFCHYRAERGLIAFAGGFVGNGGGCEGSGMQSNTAPRFPPFWV